ncbi:hypothetical protein [Saccharopolyspora sp. NPDC002686]|uniref:hypothetical protein n=1 Tax=Saccharopolyspora sp. NPDC002686 TaxID=3154541 RepID=UPI0033191D11
MFPIQAPPVPRPDHVVDPMVLYSGVDIDYAQLSDIQIIEMQATLAGDANFNDPQWFATPSVEVMRVSGWPGGR